MTKFQLVFLLLTLTSRAILHAQYSVTPIAFGLEWSGSEAAAINSFGDVAGVGYTSGSYKVFLYRNGALTNLGSLGGGSAYVWGMNDLGDVVGGSSVVDGGNAHAFLYSDGQMQDLGALSVGWSEAWAVNNSRRVVGRAPYPPFGTIAFFHDDGSAFLEQLGSFPGGIATEANDVNDAGEIAGAATGNGSNTWVRAFLWTNGNFLDLGQMIDSSRSVSAAVNDLGEIVGYYQDTNSVANGFLYSDGKIQLLGLGSPNCINNLGQIVGQSPGIPYLRDRQGGNININSLLNTNSGWTVLSAKAINDAGQIAGIGRTNGNSGSFWAILLTPPSRLIAPMIMNNQFEFTLQSPINRTNRIQVSPDLNTWLPFAEIVASVPLTKISSNIISNSSQFFRVAN